MLLLPQNPHPAGDTAQHTIQKVGFNDLPETSDDTQSAISYFPSDVLSLIFQYACPGPIFDGRYYRPDTTILQSLSLVSKHWYRTSMDTSELWTIICMHMEGNDASAYAAGLASFFGKTSHRHLSVSLDFSNLSDFDDGILLHPSVDTTILQNLERIEKLVLVKPPLAWFSHLNHLNRVDHLSFYLIQGGVPHISFDDFPSLSKFTLVDGDVRVPTASSCLVTSLTLISVPPDTCFHIIVNCRQLTRLHLEDYSNSGQQRLDGTLPVIPVEAFKTQQLESLVWKVFNTGFLEWQRAILQVLNGSPLQTLVWHDPLGRVLRIFPDGNLLGTAMKSFFSRLSPTLTCLELVANAENGWNDSLFMDLLYAVPSIDSLKLSEWDFSSVVYDLEDFSIRRQLPKLRTLTFGKIMGSHRGESELGPETLEAILLERFIDMLKVFLKITEDQELALYLEDDSLFRGEDGSNYRWLDRIKSDVLELVRGSGRQLNIFIASKPVDWL